MPITIPRGGRWAGEGGTLLGEMHGARAESFVPPHLMGLPDPLENPGTENWSGTLKRRTLVLKSTGFI